jgi:CBS domain containing-hemolysin-like protein
MPRWNQSRSRWTAVFMVLLVMTGAALAVGVVGQEPSGVSVNYSHSDVLLLAGYVLLALMFSFLCSVAEAVLLSITPSYIASLRENRPQQADLLKRLKQDKVDQSLAAILTLNTIAHTVGAIGAGAKATAVFGDSWFGLFSAVMTLMILFLSEIIPKTLGAVYWRKLSGATAIFVRGLILILYPLIVISEKLTRLIAHHGSGPIFSRAEFIAMARVGYQAGQIDEDESRIIKNLFRFESLKTDDIMTPRTVIQALCEETTVDEAMNAHADTPFSRLPLYKKNMDDITGFVLKNDMLLTCAKDQGQLKLKTLKRELATVTGEMSLSLLLDFLLDHRKHIALVLDEYGGTQGLVTLEDVVETLLGMEIVDEMDQVEDMQALARKQWSKRAKALGLDVDLRN